MKYSEVLDALQNLIGFMPKQATLCQVVGCTASKMSARAQRDSNFPDDEVRLIEAHYGVMLLGGNDPDKITLDYYPDVFGSCGTGCIVFEETKEKISVTKDLIKNYSTVNEYSVISARGSSMSPIIENNDNLIIQKWNGEQIIDDSIYLFRYKDELFIKRLVKNVDQIICISENPRFTDRVIDELDKFNIVGRVVGLIRNM